MTREEVLNTMGQILFALEDSKCPEARMMEQVMQWVEELPIAVPAGDLYQTAKPEGTLGATYSIEQIHDVFEAEFHNAGERWFGGEADDTYWDWEWFKERLLSLSKGQDSRAG